MKSRPILFSAPMVRALLAGTKTQTRRLVKPQPFAAPDMKARMQRPGVALFGVFADAAVGDEWVCPYGQPGDQLWVRETWAEGIHQMADVDHWAYAADHFGVQQRLGERWKPSIHMPRAASRITMEITGVRVERLQDISASDALAEGVDVHPDHHSKPQTSIYSPVQAYRDLWESINGQGSWDLNPWVWSLDFRRIT